MTIEEMRTQGETTGACALMENEKQRRNAFQLGAIQWFQVAALCERLEAVTAAQQATNEALARIAAALENVEDRLREMYQGTRQARTDQRSSEV